LAFLKAGDYLCTQEDLKVHVVLGSCVSVFFYSPRLKLGGGFHAFLPSQEQRGNAVEPLQSDWQFVDRALPRLIRDFQSRGIGPEETRVFLAGGASNLQAGRSRSVGDMNVGLALSILEAGNYVLNGRETGGTAGRVCHFYPASGKLSIRIMGDPPQFREF